MGWKGWAVLAVVLLLTAAAYVVFSPTIFPTRTGRADTTSSAQLPSNDVCPSQNIGVSPTSCFPTIQTLNGSYFTSMTASFYFPKFPGENGSSGCKTCFTVQLNTNFYDNGLAWYQAVANVGSVTNGTVYAWADLETEWVGKDSPPPTCPSGWTNYTGGLYCREGGFSLIQIGQNFQIPTNGSLTLTTTFASNNTNFEDLAFAENNKTLTMTRNFDLLPISPYGSITEFFMAVVGPAGGFNADFAEGTDLTMMLHPVMNMGSAYGTNWGFGGEYFGTGESGNLYSNISIESGEVVAEYWAS